MDTSQYGRRLALVIGIAARLSALPEAVVANSAAGRAHHLGLGYHPRRFPVIANGIDTDRFRPDPAVRHALRSQLGIAADTPLLAHVARLDPMKDHATLVAALDRLPGVTALAVGAGSEGLPEQPRLFRLGRRDDMPAIYAACDLVVSTSAFGEGFSTVLGEGMATALPAVATDVGDAAAIVGDCGRIVPPRQPGALAAAVRDLLALSATERAAIGHRARQRIVGEYSLARAVAAFDALHRGEEV
jgi:glycosyltransferase involved in cell wall biosynthesis